MIASIVLGLSGPFAIESAARPGRGGRPVQLTSNERIADAELVRRIGQGDRWAEEAFYRRYVALVHGTVRRLLGRAGEAEDVVQETFATAFEIFPQLRTPESARQWLMQIAVRKVHRRFRRRRLLRTLGLDRSVDDAPLEQMAPPDSSAKARLDLTMLNEALSNLGTAERIAWMLRHVEGHSLDEVATQCGCSLATAKRRIFAAHTHVCRYVALEGSADE
jgi:RNA polymerase sigma-70 factor (ECF subfamily)